MRHPYLLATICLGAGVVVGGAKAYIDSQAGPGTTHAAVTYGINSAGELGGEAASALPNTAGHVLPALRDGLQMAGSVLNGTANGATTTTSPPANEGAGVDQVQGGQP